MSKMSNRRLLVIGLDGATLDLLEPWADSGELPTLRQFKSYGVIGDLESVFPPVTPVAWASFITGKNPGKHGIPDFGVRQEGSYERVVAYGGLIRSKAFWGYLSEAGIKVGIARVPITYPATKVNGFMVTGIFSPLQESETYPLELKSELKRNIKDYRSTLKVHKFIDGIEEDYFKDVLYTTRKHAEEALYLLENKDWDFFMYTFFYGDQIQHFFWKFMDPTHPLYDKNKAKKFGNAILEYYKLIDEVIASMLEKVGESTDIIIMSDHGAGPVYKDVYINNWLNELGYLHYKNTTTVQSSLLSRIGLSQKTAVRIISKFRLAWLLKSIPRFLAEKFYWNLPEGRLGMADVDWTKTKAYSLGYFGQIFINLKGREPEGIVTLEEYDNVREEIMDKLKELRDPETNEKLVDKIFKREELFHGPFVDQAADILFIMKGLEYMVRGSYEFGYTGKDLLGWPGNGESATHRMNGLFMAKGPSFKKGSSVVGARLIDLAPTILHMFGLPIPSDMDGEVLVEVFNEKSNLAKEIKKYEAAPDADKRRLANLSEDEENKIKERLRKLGYM